MLITIPFTQDKNIGAEYNRIMKSTNEAWVGFMDHDAMFLPGVNWHKILTAVIEKLDDNVGFLSCVANRIGAPIQKAEGIDSDNHDINYHIGKAREIYNKYGLTISDVTNSQWKPSALMFLTNKKAWQAAGGFKETEWLGVDNDYGDRLKKAGYRINILKGLYIYHWYRGGIPKTLAPMVPEMMDKIQNVNKSQDRQNLSNQIIDSVQKAVSSDEYFISVSHRKPKDQNGNDRDHYLFQKNFKAEVESSLEHIKSDFIKKDKRGIKVEGFV